MNNTLIKKIGQQFRIAQRVLVVSHIRPDGDAIGSLLGLGLSLQAANKEVQMVLSDGVPSSFRHLIGSDQVRYRPEGEFDLVCVVDCSDLQRVGSALNGYSQPDLNIDHHVTNLKFAAVNLVDTKATATAEILTELIPAVGLPMSQAAAAALVTGLITDTLGFRTSNMTSKALHLVADLMKHQVNYPELYRRALVSRSFEAARFWGAGLTKLQRDGRLVWTTLTTQDRKAAGYPGRDDADLVNILSSIDDADVAVIFIEQPDEKIKVSWRSQPGFDVSPIALSFGGGGHPSASGADIDGELDEVKSNVLRVTRALLEREEVSLG